MAESVGSAVVEAKLDLSGVDQGLGELQSKLGKIPDVNIKVGTETASGGIQNLSIRMGDYITTIVNVTKKTGLFGLGMDQLAHGLESAKQQIDTITDADN